MQDINKELEKYGLSREAYESCLKDIRDKILGLNDMDWAEITDKYNLNIHYDTLRKASQTPFGNVFVIDYFKEKQMNKEEPTNGYLAELKQTKREIIKEKQKIRDEKLEYNRWLREEARDELITEKICDAVRELPEIPFNNKVVNIDFPKSKEGILCFADTHYGAEYSIKGLHGEILNEYSPEIFEERMEELLAKTIEKVNKEGFDTIHVFSLGDELDGILRCSQLMKLRYGVVESTIKYSEYICRWLSRLCQVVRVKFHTVEGNHTELRMIDQPKGTFTEDNLSRIIKEFIKTRLENNPNFTLIDNESGLIFDNIAGYNVLAIHGEVKNLAEAIHEFSNVYNTPVDILIGGHSHHYKAETVGIDKDIVSVPSIIGIDDYSMSLRRVSNSGALFLIIEEGNGIIEQSTFKFNK